MSNLRIENVSRRRFLQRATGLTLAVYFPQPFADANARQGEMPWKESFEPNAFLRIGTDGTVTVISKHLEMGQGIYTGLATIVAEELDASWSQVQIEGAPADASRYTHTVRTGFQITGGSSSIANSWALLRQAGASARAMLVAAAAQRWNVAAAEITVNDGVVAHAPSQQHAGFGELAAAAAKLPVPTQVSLKDPKHFKLIGKHVPRKDSADKTNGAALFTSDITLPDMLTAVVVHAPRFGATVKSFDAAKTKSVKGVVDVVRIPSGVAVLAKDTWSAKKGRDALHARRSSFRRSAVKPPAYNAPGATQCG